MFQHKATQRFFGPTTLHRMTSAIAFMMSQALTISSVNENETYCLLHAYVDGTTYTDSDKTYNYPNKKRIHCNT